MKKNPNNHKMNEEKVFFLSWRKTLCRPGILPSSQPLVNEEKSTHGLSITLFSDKI